MNSQNYYYPKIVDITVLQSPANKRKQYPILLSLYPRISNQEEGLTKNVFNSIFQEIKNFIDNSNGAAKCKQEKDGLTTNIYTKDVNGIIKHILDKILKTDYKIAIISGSDYYIDMAELLMKENEKKYFNHL